jgi:uncharacterized protein (DUF433 family)
LTLNQRAVRSSPTGDISKTGYPQMQQARTYVRQDEHGVLRVGDTRVMLDSVVAAFHLGHSAETIAQQYPALTLEEVYGAIAHYLANQADVDQYLRNQEEVWKEWREKANAAESPVVQRLRDLAARTRSNAK